MIPRSIFSVTASFDHVEPVPPLGPQCGLSDSCIPSHSHCCYLLANASTPLDPATDKRLPRHGDRPPTVAIAYPSGCGFAFRSHDQHPNRRPARSLAICAQPLSRSSRSGSLYPLPKLLKLRAATAGAMPLPSTSSAQWLGIKEAGESPPLRMPSSGPCGSTQRSRFPCAVADAPKSLSGTRLWGVSASGRYCPWVPFGIPFMAAARHSRVHVQIPPRVPIERGGLGFQRGFPWRQPGEPFRLPRR